MTLNFIDFILLFSSVILLDTETIAAACVHERTISLELRRIMNALLNITIINSCLIAD